MAKKRRLLRLIVPAYPKFNIYTAIAKRTTGLGLVLLASAANKLPGWEVEIIDENNCRKRKWPKNAPDGWIDHAELQKHRPADIVGFYASMSSCIPRVFELAKLYKGFGAVTVAGGYHARALPQDMLNHDIDIVAMDGGEQSMIDIMRAFDAIHAFSGGTNSNVEFMGSQEAHSLIIKSFWENATDIAFMNDGKMIQTPVQRRSDKCEPWPLPDFGLLKYAKIKTYPIMWRSGCPYNCEFCAVKDKPEWTSAEEFMARVIYLVEKFRAKHFFIVDDHFGGSLNNPDDYAETIKLLKLLQDYQKRIGRRLSFTVQIRLNMSEKSELLSEMKKANIDHVCIGYESPIEEDLLTMNKGYDAADMIKWTKQWRNAGFFVHGMFIFAYPRKETEREKEIAGKNILDYSVQEIINAMERPLTIKEQAAVYRYFIKKAKIDTAQVLLAVPLPGTELRERLIAEGRLLPDLGWEYYDGQFPLYWPDNATPEELQDAMKSIMGGFYGFGNIPKLFVNWCFHFPRIVFPSVLTLLTFHTNDLVDAYRQWRDKYHRNTMIRAGGWFIVKNWVKQLHAGDFRAKLKKAQEALKDSKNS